MRFVPFLALIALASPSFAHADPEGQKERKICRAEPSKTGSIMPNRKVCHTKAEWAAIDRANGNQNELRQRRDGSAPLRPDAG